MPDISMCKGEDCPIKNKCYRFTATPSQHWQSYFTESPYQKETKKCKHFWSDKNNKERGKN
jgi:hypothetical protein